MDQWYRRMLVVVIVAKVMKPESGLESDVQRTQRKGGRSDTEAV